MAADSHHAGVRTRVLDPFPAVLAAGGASGRGRAAADSQHSLVRAAVLSGSRPAPFEQGGGELGPGVSTVDLLGGELGDDERRRNLEADSTGQDRGAVGEDASLGVAGAAGRWTSEQTPQR